ncbi:hypothetical protein [Teredinibacter turnerae]|uniref:hypothetical protein n=1 Tax=Teredinibacter turnerae TaxID=2426 RepID=UPI0005A0E034|nr:hypothetical protein [Teredinibacter turnerae]
MKLDRVLKMKKYISFILALCISAKVVAGTEAGLKILKIGAWAQGSSTFYIKVDRTVGPQECRSDLIKVDLGSDSDSETNLMSKNMARSMALVGLASGLDVELVLPDHCLYGNPTITQIWLAK